MAVAKKQRQAETQRAVELPKGKQVRCRCGRVGVLVQRDRLTIYEGEDEPWTSFGEEPGEGRLVVACEECSWAATFTTGVEGYSVSVQQGKKAATRVCEEWLE